ncbi:glutathione S-transferase [Abyssibius alkaniclasticus]|uniref:glutathione S-transferase n=1 Tax=Abyssibius alkaniclasticus TaxID=2881234 RepID=UPI00405A2E82
MCNHPIFWSFRRCPYAMRARLAVLGAGLKVELREIVLRDKPQAFLNTSPSATVPALRLGDKVLDESLDIMVWALKQRDPQRLLDMPDEGWQLIARNDGPFKAALDHTKYAVRYPDLDPRAERAKAAAVLDDLNARLQGKPALFGARDTIADLAVLPFLRQFAHIDRAWFAAQPWPGLHAYLNRFMASDAFARIMPKYAPWRPGAAPLWFGG